MTEMSVKQQFVSHLLKNLQVYCEAANEKIKNEPELLQLERSKMFLVSKKHSHQDEIAKRLEFLEFYETEGMQKITK